MENDPLLNLPPKIWNFPYVLSLFFLESFPKQEDVGHRDFGNLPGQSRTREEVEFIEHWRSSSMEEKRACMRAISEEGRRLLFNKVPNDLKNELMQIMREEGISGSRSGASHQQL